MKSVKDDLKRLRPELDILSADPIEEVPEISSDEIWCSIGASGSVGIDFLLIYEIIRTIVNKKAMENGTSKLTAIEKLEVFDRIKALPMLEACAGIMTLFSVIFLVTAYKCRKKRKEKEKQLTRIK